MFSVSAEYVPTTVLITCSGAAGRTEICAALAFGGQIALASGRAHFLFDMLAVDFEGTTEDRLAMGRYAATQLAGVERIAVVLTPEVHTGEGEQAARQGGIDLRNFHELHDGLDWLSRLDRHNKG
jgi:hypothetical protein